MITYKLHDVWFSRCVIDGVEHVAAGDTRAKAWMNVIELIAVRAEK